MNLCGKVELCEEFVKFSTECKLVANAPYTDDPSRMSRIILYFFSQFGDMCINSSRVDQYILTPYGIQDIIPAQHF